MKFALVLPHLKVGGAQKQAVLLFRELSARGHTVRFVLTDPRSRLAKDRFQMLTQLEIDPSIVLTRKSRVNLMAWYSLLYDLLNRQKPSRDQEGPRFLRPPHPFGKLLLTSKKVAQRIFIRPIASLGAKNLMMRFQDRLRKSRKVLLTAIAWPLPFLVHRNIRLRLRGLEAGQANSISALVKRPTILLRADHLAKVLTPWKPDAIVSFLTQSNILSILAMPARYPVAISERNDVVRQPVRPEIGGLRKTTYPGAALITANSPHVVTDLDGMFPDSRVQWFPNQFPLAVSPRDDHQKTLGMLCRIEAQKNVRLVVEAFLGSSARLRGWKLIIFGNGPERDSIAKLLEHVGAEAKVELPGVTNNPTQALEQIDVFISASDYEGSSNSIHEAVASGSVPLVASTVGEYREIVPQRLFRATSFSLSKESLRKRLDAVCAEEHTLAQMRQDTRTYFERYWARGREVREKLLTEFEQLAQKP